MFGKRRFMCLGLLTVLCSLAAPVAAGMVHAQAATESAICVIVYHDANQNAVRDPGEEALVDVNVNVQNTSNVILANYVTASQTPYCFGSLPPQQYVVTISSPLYQAVEAAPTAFPLEVSQRITLEFGVVPRLASTASDPVSDILVIPLTPANRLIISALCAAGVMVLLSGVGLVIYGMFFHTRAEPAPEPVWVTEPGMTEETGGPDDDAEFFSSSFDEPA